MIYTFKMGLKKATNTLAFEQPHIQPSLNMQHVNTCKVAFHVCIQKFLNQSLVQNVPSFRFLCVLFILVLSSSFSSFLWRFPPSPWRPSSRKLQTTCSIEHMHPRTRSPPRDCSNSIEIQSRGPQRSTEVQSIMFRVAH